LLLRRQSKLLLLLLLPPLSLMLLPLSRQDPMPDLPPKLLPWTLL
jgi:hypothetical protein